MKLIDTISMRRQLLLPLLFVMATVSVNAQTNLQVHYDFGENRSYVTTTLEMFKPDDWGNTFFFVDMDFNYGSENHPSTAYMEIARCLKFWDGPLSLQVEYNGGLGIFENGVITGGYPIKNAYLVGLDYGINNADFSKTLNLKALYKRIAGVQHSAQLTAVWGLNWMDNKLSFAGYADIWFEKDPFIGTEYMFQSEPQLWYNVNEHLSAGTEVEVALNFNGKNYLTACPTIGLKWNF